MYILRTHFAASVVEVLRTSVGACTNISIGMSYREINPIRTERSVRPVAVRFNLPSSIHKLRVNGGFLVQLNFHFSLSFSLKAVSWVVTNFVRFVPGFRRQMTHGRGKISDLTKIIQYGGIRECCPSPIGMGTGNIRTCEFQALQAPSFEARDEPASVSVLSTFCTW
jgi:hypothetical protein